MLLNLEFPQLVTECIILCIFVETKAYPDWHNMEATREATALWKSPRSAGLEVTERFPGQPDPVPDLVTGNQPAAGLDLWGPS